MVDPENSVLPPFAALRVFHVAARSNKMKEAADKLGLTEPAVSHQIRKLEEFLGCKLFERHAAGVTLTDDGQRFFRGIEPAFKALIGAVEDMTGGGASTKVTVTLPPSLAILWLIPRLSSFEAAHPAIDLALSTTTRLVDLTRERVDLSIRYGTGNWPDLDVELLLEERVSLVASPGLATAFGSRPLSDITRGNRLITTPYYGAEWQEWLQARGLPAPNPGQLIGFDTYEQSLEAAAEGLGLLLGRDPLMRRYRKAGTLVDLAQQQEESRAAFFLCAPKGTPLRAAARTAKRWLLSQAE